MNEKLKFLWKFKTKIGWWGKGGRGGFGGGGVGWM